MFDRDTLDMVKRLLEKCPDRIIDVIDSLSTNQYASKEWLIEKLNEYPHHFKCKTLDKNISVSIFRQLVWSIGTLVDKKIYT